ncbi:MULTISPECIES: FtsW/RodA/SpoVE family cell cycle protein [Corynebacterium]|uniref:FtsW/RodA/SpoVE family cell cycle protein n=1 Tax=Corynebacterium TaxID=1716 RepID=UPI00124E8355|nr:MULTISPECIES: putative peptidoglycan glycosyltransferase FtsW [Corynebacterium]
MSNVLTNEHGGRRKYFHVALRPLLDYYAVASIVVILAFFGILMVASSSMTWSVLEGASVFGTAMRQAVMVGVGFVAMWLCLRLRPQSIRRSAPWVLIVSVLLLVLVLVPSIGTGLEEVGSQSWIVLGPIRLQPSELAKVAIAVWGSAWLADCPPEKKKIRFIGFIVIALLMLGLILLEKDVGMALAFLVVVGVTLVFAGLDLRYIVFTALATVIGLALAVKNSSGFRSDRISVFKDAFFGRFDDTRGAAFQSYQGYLSLSDGSLFGVGPGQSRAKWFYLPEAKNDFIFAIIGEETGLLGATMVIVLYAALCVLGFRIALRSNNRFLSLLAATLTGSIVIQAFINIGYVIGLWPVTGIQLPLISAGGTSAIITLASMGLLLNCARHEPEAISALQSHGRPWFDRLLMLPEPMVTGVSVREGRGESPRGGGEHEQRDARPSSRRREALTRHSERDRVRRYGEPLTHVRRRPSSHNRQR